MDNLNEKTPPSGEKKKLKLNKLHISGLNPSVAQSILGGNQALASAASSDWSCYYSCQCKTQQL